MGYDGFLGYVNEDDPMSDDDKSCIDKFLILPKTEQNIYFAMYDKNMDYCEKSDEFGKIIPYTMQDWIKTALKHIKGFSKEDCTNYALRKSLDNIKSTKIIGEKKPIEYSSILEETKEKVKDIISYCNEEAIQEVINKIDDTTDLNAPIKFKNVKSSHISWDEFFMGVAELAAKRSKDPSTKVGACIVKDNHIISTGYNGMPYCESVDNDEEYPWTREGEDQSKTKYFYVVHAEENAILSSPVPVKGGTLYCTLFPCNECAKAIIQSHIKEVVYKEYREEKIFNCAMQMIKNAGIKIRKY